jgi:hypothetical protein
LRRLQKPPQARLVGVLPKKSGQNDSGKPKALAFKFKLGLPMDRIRAYTPIICRKLLRQSCHTMTSPKQSEASTNTSHISQLTVCHGRLPEENTVSWQCTKDRECDVCGKLCAQDSAWLLALHAYLTGKRTSKTRPVAQPLVCLQASTELHVP